MELVISIVAKIAEYTVAPVGQWLCYSCHYNSNMENLRNQKKNLRDFKKRVLHSIDAASRKGEEIEDDVKTWLTKVDGILHQLATKILGGGEAEAGTRSSNAACLNLKHRHQLSREAKKIVENIAELLKNGNFSKVGFCPAAQEMVNPINRDYMSLDSRISIMERIMEALGDANINRIGVWGSAGVGKSTLMKEIFQKAKEESLFHEVALANVTDTLDVIRIQGEIAEMLDLELDPDKIVTVRAGRLRARLEKDNEKKILVILDDVWKQLDLEEIGITPSERCKVLLTSRDRQVLADEMRTEENSFKLDIVGEQEAWKLFEKMAGDSIKDDHDLQNQAIKVAKACEGLPIALVTVSRALKNKNLSTWKDVLVQLTRPTPKHDTKIWSRVYSCIELSYIHLDGREVKSLFLLCARQGYYVSYRDLLRYGFGLRLFYGIDTLEEARNRLETLVNNLRDSCLLLQSPHSSKEFYMHDVVRRVATIIASNDHNMFVMRGDGGQKAWPDVDALKICEALSIYGGDHIHKYPNKIECPNLRYFHVQCKNRYLATPSSTSFQGMDKLEDIFFQGMDKLEVLSLTNIQLSSLLSLRNLQTLCLDECKLEDIHGIGELKNLVILSLARSDISNLPTEIGLLTRLRLLDLSSCYKLKVIPPNVLSSLVNLEELYMRKITVQWEVEGPSNEGKNASLAELKKLSHLITLEIDIPDANNLPKDLFTEKLKRYKICIGGTWHLFFKEELAFSRMLKLKLNMSFQLDFGIKMLLKRTEYLHLDESNITKSVLYQLDREDFQQLKHLCIENNGNIKHIPELRTSAFKNLKVLKVENCETLRFIFSSSIARGLSLLEELNITRCNNMGAIFVKEEEDEIEDQGDMMLFGRLQTLVLKDLPKLVGFLSTRETNSEGNLHDFQLPLLHHQGKLPLIYFKNLKVLKVENCQKLRFVSSSSIARGLSLLKKLKIKRCNNMGAIVVTEEKDGIEDGDVILFHQLQTLVLEDLPELVSFLSTKSSFMTDCGQIIAEGNHNLHMPLLPHQVSFPSLQTLHMEGLPKIKHVWNYGQEPKTVFTGLEQLQVVEIMDCGVEEIVAVERGGGEAVAIRILVFPQVITLNLINLKRLKWFYKGVHVTKWPMLKWMKIEGCEKVEIFASGVVSFEKTVQVQRQSEMSIKQPLFSVDELSFPSLETLGIANMDSLEIIFGKLEGQNGKEPQVLISPGSRTEESGAITNFAPTVVFPSLQTLHMEDLPKIKHVWSEYSKTVFNFQNLQKIQAVRCESLKSLFPISVVSCLEQLKILEISNCGVEEIVAVEGGGGEAVAIRTLVFPQVTKLKFRNLKRLKWFYKGVHVSKWPMLKEMEIGICEKVKIFASGFVSFQETVKDQRQSEMSNIKQPIFSVDELSFPSLKKLYIRNMDKLEIVWQDQVAATSIPNIQELEIDFCHKLLHVFQSNLHATTTTLMQSLTSLRISRCSSLESIFGNMEGQNGKESQVLKAPSSGTEDGIAGHIEFPILTQLSLFELPKLKWIFEGVHTNLESWPSLKRLCLWECSEQVNKMMWASKFASSSSSQENQLPTCIQQPMFVVEEGTFPNLEDLSLKFLGRTIRPSRFLDFPNLSFLLTRLPNLLKLNVYDSVWEEIFPYELIDREIRLRRLTLCRLCMLTHLWKEDSTQPCQLFHNLEYLHVLRCGKLKNIVPSSVSLRNLTRLEISHCHGLINLLTSSTAKTLVQLKRMTVIDCKRITEIVAMEDIGEANVAITFNKLTYLKLDGLPNFTHFCSGPYSFGFPSLKEVIVRCCPEMKIFCHGVLSTPELKGVSDADYSWNSKQNLHLEDDLNTTTRCLWESNQYDTQCLFRERCGEMKIILNMHAAAGLM
ncbi:uncharacterized protein LOC122318465 isoform X2 [Carya illinoinensis]|uniref:AAA+ ATPase domain-containing protein n=1 Tax=Carya illinoinensis TaxID=32201 RepID=A0A8T1PZP1_CARIL|nr:uncharacterized protein LOC122318465 isoform X2 [Carya illinoinensis]KAG6646201.1 hypothetical protein CIPAW_08G177100 [Carya illinoinensis]KAG6646202.1 hypothetical protein CIPAW_08G177100 [Carya illinoinensis]KAG6646203.1 hypothetical protein CIPAW_08G177100 [Carya illinoinensis]KAG6646204.1 hypothetical protein CIPAW_08G177100 [Carya illinoinensis]